MKARAAGPDDALARVDAARAAGADAADPVGWAVIEGLARRAAGQQGELRRELLQRIERRLARQAEARALPAAEPATARRDGLAQLSTLVDRLGRASVSPAHAAAAPAPLKSVTAFNRTWSRLRADQRLRQARVQVPSMAGPLNSSKVVNQALLALRELSPAYLDAFVSQVDTLLWLEQASGAGPLAPRVRRKA